LLLALKSIRVYLRVSAANRARLVAGAAFALQLAGYAPAALPQSQADLQINTPAITSLREGLRARHREQLRGYYENGAIGLTRDGLIAMRDANAIPLAQRQQVNALIAADNQDRLALYKEVARANNHPEWESEIRATFAKRWIERVPEGWYYQDANGIWVRK
jgi:uncharacterized protein YdbL (DUF1318 family)